MIVQEDPGYTQYKWTIKSLALGAQMVTSTKQEEIRSKKVNTKKELLDELLIDLNVGLKIAEFLMPTFIKLSDYDKGIKSKLKRKLK